MNSWKIFKHSVGMVVSNLGVAVKLAIPLIAVMLLSLILWGPEIITGDMGFDPYADMAFDTMMAGQSLLSVFLQIIASLWVAVAWHRFILLEETPDGVLPPFHGSRVLAYFGWGLLLAVIIGLSAGVLGGIGGMSIAMGSGFTGLIGGLLIVAAVLVAVLLSARLYVILPAAAVGRKMSLGEAWEATRGYAPTIILAYVIFIIMAIIFGGIIGGIAAFTGFVGALLMIAIEVALTMIGFSFLTTIYGVTVEGREVN